MRQAHGRTEERTDNAMVTLLTLSAMPPKTLVKVDNRRCWF